MSDTDLLWAYAAAEAASVAKALEALCKQGEGDEEWVRLAWSDADQYSVRWAARTHNKFYDNDERLHLIREYLTEHAAELEELLQRLVI